ncbi:MAG: ABC transporter ATP-binding protein [Solirubrobacteraceae bacterium]
MEVPTARPLLSLEGVWRGWGRRGSRRTVLRGVDLALGPGAAVAVTGANGAGKTTLLRIAAGILAPDAGRVTVDGIAPERSWREFHRWIGLLSAGDRGLYVRLSVRGHLEYWTALAFMAAPERRQAVKRALVQFGLRELAGRRADRLSQGQRQRLRLALAVVHRPKLLLLDEPRTSLDDQGKALLDAAVGETLERGGAALWCAPLGDSPPPGFDRMLLGDGELRPA